MPADQPVALSRDAEVALWLGRLRTDELRFVACLLRTLPHAEGYSAWDSRTDIDRVGACRDASRLLEALADAR